MKPLDFQLRVSIIYMHNTVTMSIAAETESTERSNITEKIVLIIRYELTQIGLLY